MAKLLVIEDESMLMQVLVDVIKEKYPRIKIHTANNGNDAVTLLSNISYDIVISDYKLPGQTGIDIFNKLKNNTIPLNGDTSFYLMSAFYKTPEISTYISSDLNFLKKPFNIDDIFSILDCNLPQ